MVNILERLHITIIKKAEIPKGFASLTLPIALAETEIIESVWSTLRSTEALVTADGDNVEFWRQIKPSAAPSYSGVVKTGSQNGRHPKERQVAV
jgi:hypothetical protein